MEKRESDPLDLGSDYARDRGWSGAGRRDEYTREPEEHQPEEDTPKRERERTIGKASE